MVIEMPVLDGAMIACGVAFLPMLLAMRYGRPAMRAVQAAANAIPRHVPPFLIDIGLVDAEMVEQRDHLVAEERHRVVLHPGRALARASGWCIRCESRRPWSRTVVRSPCPCSV
jgi:hypothetical protein